VRRRIVVPRRAFVPVVLCSLLTLAACARGEKRPDTAAASAAGAKPAALVGTAAPRAIQANLPGALAKPLDSLSGEELYAFTRKLAFGGGVEKDRNCKDSPECKAAKPVKTKVRVDAVDGQDSVSVFGVPDNGVIAVQAKNKGPFVDELYGMKPDKNLEYYLVLLPGTDIAGRWRLEELDTTPNARRHSQIAAGTLKPCMHAFVKRKVNRANFYTCADAHMLNDSVSSAGLVLQSANDPMWIDCAQGCCVASSP
jgi:hypothetical protein